MTSDRSFVITAVGSPATGEKYEDFAGDMEFSDGVPTRQTNTLDARGIGIIAPDDTPFYSFVAYHADGHLIAYGSEIQSKVANIECDERLDSNCRFIIFGAADAGAYQIKVKSK